jgi:hypothetical protein
MATLMRNHIHMRRPSLVVFVAQTVLVVIMRSGLSVPAPAWLSIHGTTKLH